MKALTSQMRAHLKEEGTTLCFCWKLTRRDGEVLGFTDHDAPLVVGGTRYEARSGVAASALESSLGLSVDNMEAYGALSSGGLDESQLSVGFYDHAAVEIYRVNWADPRQYILVKKGTLGEVRRTQDSFTAEVRSLAQTLNHSSGRLFQYTCDADLGDTRCGVNLNSARFRGTGRVSALLSASTFEVAGLSSFQDGWFTHGSVSFSGRSGFVYEVRKHTKSGAKVILKLWEAPGQSVGASFTVQAGCDKQFSTCHDRFNNRHNYRGFPHMPGNDFVQSYARSGLVNDGGSRVR